MVTLHLTEKGSGPSLKPKPGIAHPGVGTGKGRDTSPSPLDSQDETYRQKIFGIADQFESKIKSLVKEEGPYVLKTSSRSNDWVRQFTGADDKESLFVGDELVRRGVLKPDNRSHKGLGKFLNSYRLSQHWMHSRGLDTK
jgi:hypothetical protein